MHRIYLEIAWRRRGQASDPDGAGPVGFAALRTTRPFLAEKRRGRDDEGSPLGRSPRSRRRYVRQRGRATACSRWAGTRYDPPRPRVSAYVRRALTVVLERCGPSPGGNQSRPFLLRCNRTIEAGQTTHDPRAPWGRAAGRDGDPPTRGPPLRRIVRARHRNVQASLAHCAPSG